MPVAAQEVTQRGKFVCARNEERTVAYRPNLCIQNGKADRPLLGIEKLRLKV